MRNLNKIALYVGCTALLTLCGCATEAAQQESIKEMLTSSQSDMHNIVRTNNGFAFDMYHQLKKNNQKSFFLSTEHLRSFGYDLYGSCWRDKSQDGKDITL